MRGQVLGVDRDGREGRIAGDDGQRYWFQPDDWSDRIGAVLFAFFLGTLGIHRFYLGKTGSGIVMLLLTCTVVGLLVTGIWALIDAIRYLVMDNDEFHHRYG